MLKSFKNLYTLLLSLTVWKKQSFQRTILVFTF